MAGNKSLAAANRAKQDEFYTRLSDIENELRHYEQHFKGKTVYCNCDDPYRSNFFRYFVLNFNHLGLKKLICTCYSGMSEENTPLSLSEDERIKTATGISGQKPYRIEVTCVDDINGADGTTDIEVLIGHTDGKPELLKGNGDFRSEECAELLKEADIVCTNPPFSLFREYLAMLYEYDKRFIIIGSQNNMTYKEVFTLMKENRLWPGYKSGDMAFTVPDNYEPRETRYWVDESGQKWRSLGNICWFTNLDIEKRHVFLPLTRSYAPEKYPKYDNYDAIEVKRVSEIPADYDGIMGVPVTFMDKYNPAQFEIVGNEYTLGIDKGRGYVNGKRLYSRIFIRRKT